MKAPAQVQQSTHGRLWRRPASPPRAVAALVAVTTTTLGMILASDWLDKGLAQAADGQVSWGGNSDITDFDPTWLYAGGQNANIVAVKYPAANNTGDAVRVNPVWSRSGGEFPSSAISTLAMGPDRTQDNRLVHYAWDRTETSSTIPVKKVTPGSSVAPEFFLPHVGTDVATSLRGWSGADVLPSTGELVINNASTSTIMNQADGTSRIGICDPTALDADKVARCTISGSLRPATAEDWLGASATQTWEVASDVATDAEGNIFMVVSQSNALGTKYLIKVMPGGAGQTWYFERMVQLVDGGANNFASDNWWGMAFAEGAVYVAPGVAGMNRIDPLTGVTTSTGWSFNSTAYALAGGRPAAGIRGHVYWDQDGSGQLAAANRLPSNGLAGVEVQLFKEGVDDPLAVTYTDGIGEYNFMLNDTSDVTWYVRLNQPQIDGYNARQTYAAGYSMLLASDGSLVHGSVNQVAPRCQGEATPGYEGPCHGARADGIDPSTGVTAANVFTETGANIVTRVQATTSKEVSVADFGLSVTGGYGDAPETYHSTRAQSGPMAFPRAGGLEAYLGEMAPALSDGSNDAVAGVHPSDDGVQVRPHSPSDSEAWQPAQDFALTVGQGYDFRFKVSGQDAGQAIAKAWLTPLEADGTARSSFSDVLAGAGSEPVTPDQDGFVYVTNHVMDSTPPADGVQRVYLRALAAVADPAAWPDLAPDFAKGNPVPAPGSPEADTNPWVRVGDVEDHGLAVTTGTLRLAARSAAVGLSSKFDFTLSNVISQAPSSDSASITVAEDGLYTWSSRVHAVETVGTGIDLTANLPVGWRIIERAAGSDQPDNHCLDATSGQLLDAQLVGEDTLRLEGSAVQVGADLECFVTFGLSANAPGGIRGVTLTPVTSPTEPVAAGDSVHVSSRLRTQVEDATGAMVNWPMAYFEVQLDLTPVAGSGATSTGAAFDDGSQVYRCTTDEAGFCQTNVTGTVAGVYQLVGATRMGPDQDWEIFPDNDSTIARSHPAYIHVTAGPVSLTQSWISLNDTADQVADGEGQYQLRIYLQDQLGNTVTGAATDLTVQAPTGVSVGPVSEDTTAGSGFYQATVTSTVAGPQRLQVDHQGGWLPAKDTDPVVDYVTATFLPGAPCQGTSSFTITDTKDQLVGTGQYVGQILLRDCHANPVPGAADELSVQIAKGAAALSQPDQAAIQLVESPAGSGDYQVTVTSLVAGLLDLTATYQLGEATAVDLGTQSVTFLPTPELCLPQDTNCTDASTLELSLESPLPYADWQFASVDPANWGSYLATVTLKDLFGNPVADGAGRITMTDLAAIGGAKYWPSDQLPPQSGSDDPTSFVCQGGWSDGHCPSGVYITRVYATVAGIHQIQAVVAVPGGDAAKLGPRPATFQVRPPEAGTSSTLTVSPTPPAVVVPDGVSHYTVTVTVLDENGHNAVPGAPIRFTLAPIGAATLSDATMHGPGGEASSNQIDLTSDNEGSAQITITALHPAGQYTLRAFVFDGAEVGGPELPATSRSPQILQFSFGGVDLDQSDFNVSVEPIVANNVDTGTVTVNLRHANGMPATHLADQLSAAGPAGAQLTIDEFSPVPGWLGQYQATVRGAKTGVHQVQVYFDDQPLTVLTPSQPNDRATLVNGRPANLAATMTPTTSLSPSHPQVVADGVDSYTITATLIDAHGNPVTDWSGSRVYKTAVPTGSPTGIATVTDPVPLDNPGVYLLTVTSHDINVFQVTLGYQTSDSLIAIPLSPDVAAFGHGPPVVVQSSWTVAPTTSLDASHPWVVDDGVDSWTATIEVRDGSGHPVPDVAVDLLVPSALFVTPAAGSHLSDAAGMVSVAITSLTVGSYPVSVALAGDLVAPDPQSVSFGHGDLSGTNCHLEAPADAVPADGQATRVVRASLHDLSDQPVDDGVVRFRVPAGTTARANLDVAGGPGVSHQVPVDQDGMAYLTLVSTQAGAYQVTAEGLFEDQVVEIEDGSPAMVRFVEGEVDSDLVVPPMGSPPDRPPNQVVNQPPDAIPPSMGQTYGWLPFTGSDLVHNLGLALVVAVAGGLMWLAAGRLRRLPAQVASAPKHLVHQNRSKPME